MNGWILILVYSLLQRNGFIRSFLPWKGALGASGVGAPWGRCGVCCESHPSHLPPTPKSFLWMTQRTFYTPKVAPGCGCDMKIRAVRGYRSLLCPLLPWHLLGSGRELLVEPGTLWVNYRERLTVYFFRHCKEGWIKVRERGVFYSKQCGGKESFYLLGFFVSGMFCSTDL